MYRTEAFGALRRGGAEGAVVFAGGGARNRFLVALVPEELGVEVLVPEDPQMVGALGAALLAAREPADQRPATGNTTGA